MQELKSNQLWPISLKLSNLDMMEALPREVLGQSGGDDRKDWVQESLNLFFQEEATATILLA